MENEQRVYGYVKSIAEEQFAKKEMISRADVAYILKEKYKVACADGAELSGLVYRAYEALGKPESIRWAISTNGGDKSVVDQYELNIRLGKGETEQAVAIVEKDLSDSSHWLDEARQKISDVLKLELAQDAAALSKWLQGTSGIEEVKTKSSALMQNYGKMVECYQAAESGVRGDIHDFVELRSDVNARFMQYANALVDVFGDSIRVVAPQLFDFDGVKYLDAASMQQSAQLEFDKLSQNCTLLLGEIASHYSATMSQVPLWLKMGRGAASVKGGVYGSLAMGVVSYLNHWLSAQEKTTQMKKEYVKFEASVKRDRHQLDGDMMRLMKIHKVMNDLYIPRAATFSRRCDEVMSADMKGLLDTLYSGEVEPLVKERDALLKRMKALEQSVCDHHENIAMFDHQITELQGMLDAQKEKYTQASSRKPVEPGALKRFFTFGVAQKNYGRRLLEWEAQDGALVNGYEEAVMDLSEGKEDKNAHSEQLERDKSEYAACKERLLELNRMIREKINCSPAQKMVALKHLKNIVTLLQAGKKIAESRLDDSLLEVVVPARLESIAPLTEEIENGLRGFVSDLAEELKNSGGEISHSIMQDFGLSSAGEESGQMAATVDKASELLKNWSYMQTDNMKSQLTDAVYRMEMERMKREFQSVMSELNQQSDALQEVMKRANVAVDKEDLRKALIDLAGMEEAHLTPQDFDDILSGKKQIEI